MKIINDRVKNILNNFCNTPHSTAPLREGRWELRCENLRNRECAMPAICSQLETSNKGFFLSRFLRHINNNDLWMRAHEHKHTHRHINRQNASLSDGSRALQLARNIYAKNARSGSDENENWCSKCCSQRPELHTIYTTNWILNRRKENAFERLQWVEI